MDALLHYFESLGGKVFLILFCVFLLFTTALFFVILRNLPFAKYHHKLRIHYKHKCRLFAIPPMEYNKITEDFEINRVYGYGRINAMFVEYFLFFSVIVFLFFALIWTILLNLGLTSINNIQIYAVDGYDLAVLIFKDKLAVLLILIISPHLVLNPIIDSILLFLMSQNVKIVNLVDLKSMKDNVKEMSLDSIFNVFKTATVPILFIYLGFKIYILVIFGKAFILENIFSINVVGVLFSLAFLLSCRSVALNEMFEKM